MKHSYEIEFVKAAKALRVFSIVPVISWDNLTTKGAFAIKPDLLLVWNEKQQQFAKSKHDFSDQEVKIVGACLFDKWWSPGIRAIEAKMNMTKPYVLYLGSSSNIAKDETAVILELQKLLPQFTVCLRPHPENQQVYSSLVGHEEVFVFTDKNSFPSSVKGQSEFGAMIKGAQAIVGINTSAMIDAVVFNKPTVAIVLPQFEKTQKLALHFSDLVDSKAVYVTHSVLECAEKIKTFPGQDDLRPFRESFVKTFVRPKGLNQFAGQVAYQEISYYLHEK
jgi:ADP-heptose:LPS heptosyltransferase